MYLGGQKDMYTEVIFFTIGLVNPSASLYLCPHHAEDLIAFPELIGAIVSSASCSSAWRH